MNCDSRTANQPPAPTPADPCETRLSRRARACLLVTLALVPLAMHPALQGRHEGIQRLVVHVGTALALVLWSLSGPVCGALPLRWGRLPRMALVALAAQSVALIGTAGPVAHGSELALRVLWGLVLVCSLQLFAAAQDLEPPLVAGTAGATAAALCGLALPAGSGLVHAPGGPSLGVALAEQLLLWIPIGLFLALHGSTRPCRLFAGWALGVDLVAASSLGDWTTLVPAVAGFAALAASWTFIQGSPDPQETGGEPPVRSRLAGVLCSWAAGMVAAALVVWLAGGVPPAAGARAEADGTSRPARWGTTVLMASDHLAVGAGLGNWKLLQPAYERRWWGDGRNRCAARPETASSDVLQFVAETGLVGVIGLTLFLVALADVFGEGLAPGVARPGRWLAAAMLSSCVAYAAGCVLSSPGSRTAPTFTVVVFMGAVGGMVPSCAARRILSPAATRGVTAACLSLLAVLVAAQSCWLAGSSRLRQGLESVRLGRTEDACERLAAARRLCPFDGLAAARYARACLDANRLDEALEATLRAERLDPMLAPLKVLRGKVLLRRRDPGAAGGAFREALALDPLDVEALLELEHLCAGSGRLEEAASLMERVIEREPREPRYLLELAGIYRQLGKRNRCWALVSETVGRWTNHVPGMLALGTLYEDEGITSVAESLFSRALQVDPGSRDARLALEALRARHPAPASSPSPPR